MLPLPNTQPNYQWLKTLEHTHPELVKTKKEVRSFYPEYTMGLSGDSIQTIFETCFPSVTNRNTKATLQALQSAFLSLSQCVDFNTNDSILGFLHGRSTARSASIERYKDRSYSNTVFTKVLDTLREYGFISCYTGFKGAGHPYGLTTLWVVEEPYVNWLTEHRHWLSVINFAPDKELLILRDNKKYLVDYPEDADTKALREHIRLTNELRNRFTWSYIPLDKTYWHSKEQHRGKPKRDYYQYVEDDKRQVIIQSDLQCQRSFRENFQTGGRFYCNAQSLSKDERSTLNINGQPTVEIDLKSLHPRLLYNMDGLEAPKDCYASDTPENRQLNKHICMLVLNCKNNKEAKKALMYEYPIDTESASSAIDSFVNRHPNISNHFFKEGWKRLQHLDSIITEKVLSECLEQGFPVLPVHDSYIASIEHTQLLGIIVSTYERLTGFKPEVSMSENAEAEQLTEQLLDQYNEFVAKTVNP